MKIEPCPYRIVDHRGWVRVVRVPEDSVRVVCVECGWCGARGPNALERGTAIREWNRVAKAARRKGGA
jgi:hypothetical protein